MNLMTSVYRPAPPPPPWGCILIDLRPSGLGFPTQLPDEVNLFFCSIFGKTVFNLREEGLFEKLFTNGCHDNVMATHEAKNTLFVPALVALCGNNVQTLLW